MRESDPSVVDIQAMSRRGFLRGAGLFATGIAAASLAGCGPETKTSQPTESPTPEATTSLDTIERSDPEKFLQQAAESLLAMHEVDNRSGGWMFRTQIQAEGDLPRYQTDRDVGAAGIGVALLQMSERYQDDSRWLDGAVKTAAWLTSVSNKTDNGGRFWKDYVDANGNQADSDFTSFDDGTIGIGDFYWQLYEKTNNPEHKAMALSALRWTFDQAGKRGEGDKQTVDKAGSQYSWRWEMDDADAPLNMGMGMGAAGMVHTMATFYERTKDSDPDMAANCKDYAEGALKYVDKIRHALADADDIEDDRPLPETAEQDQDGGTALNSGYLSGAAGAAFAYMKAYQVFGNDAYRDSAEECFDWLNEDTDNEGTRVNKGDTSTWQLMLDPQSDSDESHANGMEEGNAGIGWSHLQAYRATGEKAKLDTARKAGNYLLQHAETSEGGLRWPESNTVKIYHANLNNGAAGIGEFLYDLYEETQEKKYLDGANGAMKWLMATAQLADGKIFWKDNGGLDDDGNPTPDYVKDPSWHWGIAGEIAAIDRMTGGKIDMPGMQRALAKR